MTRLSPVAVLKQSPDAPEPRVAVLLNANARAVNRKVTERLGEVVPRGDLYLSRTLEEAADIVADCIERGYDTVLTGGGDGTFMGFYNAFLRQCGHAEDAESADALSPNVRTLTRQRPLPRFGVLRLGTGNAIAEFTGARSLRRRGVQHDILHARSGRLPADVRLDLVEVEGVKAPFTGLGHDALILNNYIRWKKMAQRTPFKMFGEASWGYGLSVAFLTIPQVLSSFRTIEVEVINKGGEARRIDHTGRTIAGPLPTGALLYRGPVDMASVGTCPYYGLGFRMFPQADRMPGRMQLRVAELGVPTILGNLRKIWKGRFTHPGIYDFEVDDVEMHFSDPMPFQIGGDAAGWRESVRFRVGERPVHLMDFGRVVEGRRLLE